VEAAVAILGMPEVGWPSIRRRLDAGFVQRVHAFDEGAAARCPRHRVETIMRLAEAPALSADGLRERCPPAAPLAEWCVAVGRLLRRTYSDVTSPSGSIVRRETSAKARKVSAPASTLPGRQEASMPAVAVAPAEAEVVVRTTSSSAATQEAAPDLGGLFVEPPLWRLREPELARVQDLRVGRVGIGHVTFHGETDCRGLLARLPEIVVVEKGEVVIYPDQRAKPEPGQGLNRPASIELFGCLPRSRAGLADPEARERYRQRVAQMTHDKGAIFEDYCCDDGTWKFRVEHF